VEKRASGVQSLDRALELLEHLADAGGSMRLAELEAKTGLPLPTSTAWCGRWRTTATCGRSRPAGTRSAHA
jgi:hypothetical protein